MTQTNILPETGTNGLEILEFHTDSAGKDGATQMHSFGVNAAKVMEVISISLCPTPIKASAPLTTATRFSEKWATMMIFAASSRLERIPPYER